MRQQFKSYFIIFSLFLLSACSSTPPQVETVEWQSHQARLQAIKNFTVNGKLAYRSPIERQAFNFYWQQQADTSELRLTTFLGQTVLKITTDGNGSTASTYQGDTLKGANIDDIITQLTGLRIPAIALKQWLLGLPTRNDEYQLNEQHLLQSLQHANRWDIEYQSYTEEEVASQPLALPEKMSLKQQDTSLKIVISNWTITQ